MVLSPNTRPAAPATAARPAPAANTDGDTPPATQPTSGAFAVQLASRPTEEDARNASTQLRSRFSSALGGKAPSVVSGTANGQTVYRVRVGGYSQAAAVEACNKVKAAGGNCFVTRQ
jgi:cell division septation protein DedD